jgi:hypothetical protein
MAERTAIKVKQWRMIGSHNVQTVGTETLHRRVGRWLHQCASSPIGAKTNVRLLSFLGFFHGRRSSDGERVSQRHA